MENQEELQELGKKLIEGYFDTQEEYEELKQQYIALKDLLELSGENVLDNIDFSVLPKPTFSQMDEKMDKLFGVK